MGDWDSLTKLLARAYPQDLVSFVLPGTRYLSEINNEFKVRSMRADFLCKAERDGEEIIIHIEFQRKKDDDMGLRTWEYNCTTTVREQMPVYSFVVYLVKEGPVAEPPFRYTFKDGTVIHTFEYTNILLWELPPQVLIQKGIEGMLPLLPLTKGAKDTRDTIVDTMITGLHNAGKDDVLSLGYAFADLVYTTEDDEQALKERFAVFQEALENSRFYQEVIQQGRQQGEIEVLRSMMTRVVKKSFPELLSLAQAVAERSTVPATLDAKVDKLLVAQTVEEARQALEENG